MSSRCLSILQIQTSPDRERQRWIVLKGEGKCEVRTARNTTNASIKFNVGQRRSIRCSDAERLSNA
eukprot:scaffold26799_cov94-Skeletonema_dohrnii-CCMP3373.AAC.1